MSNPKGFQNSLETLIEELAGGKEKGLADLLEIKPENVNKWTNRGSLPSAEQLENMARKLGVNINWLLTGDGEMRADNAVKYGKPRENEPPPERKRKKIYWEDAEVSLFETGCRLKGIRGSLSLRQAAEISGMSASAIKNFEAGKQAPDVQYLYWAAGYGHTNATWIMTGENPAIERMAAEEKPRYGQPITPEEREILEMYRSAPKEARESVKAILKIYQESKRP